MTAPRITKVQAQPDLILMVYFDDKTIAVDFKPFLAGTGSPLLDQAFFNQVELINGFPTWPGGIDIEPEDLFQMGKPV